MMMCAELCYAMLDDMYDKPELSHPVRDVGSWFIVGDMGFGQ